MRNIVIVGTGAVAAEITSYIEDTPMGKEQNIQIKGYLDYEENIDKYWKHYSLSKPVLGDIDSYRICVDDYFVIGVSNVEFRKKVITQLQLNNARFLTLIHPTAIVARNASLGCGCFISPYCMIGPNVVIGDFNHLTSQSVISHDTRIGNNNILSTALLCGHVNVGDDNMFYIKSTVIPHISIGCRNIVQAGMIVDKDLENDAVIFHKFKEKIIAIPKG